MQHFINNDLVANTIYLEFHLAIFVVICSKHNYIHVSARTLCITSAPPQHATRPQGDTYDDTILLLSVLVIFNRRKKYQLNAVTTVILTV